MVDSDDRPDYLLRFSDWPVLLDRTPEPVRDELGRLQRRVAWLERELANRRRQNDSFAKPDSPPSAPVESSGAGKADWPGLLARTPAPVRQEIERLERQTGDLEREFADQSWKETLPSSLRRNRPAPASPLAKAPPEQVEAVCKRFRITTLNIFGEGEQAHLEDQACIVFVRLEEGVDPYALDLDALETELERLLERTVNVRFL